MSPRYSVIGPLHEPASRSGVHGGPYRRCDCSPSYGQSCEACDGVRAERFWRPSDDAGLTTPPCMRPTTTYTEEAKPA